SADVETPSTPPQVPEDAGPPPQQPPSTEKAEEQPPFSKIFSLVDTEATNEQIEEPVNRQVAWDIEKSGLTTSTIVVLHDDHSMHRLAADRIYQALSEVNRSKPILLILNSSGGDIATAYLIAKLCREHTTASFEVAVPRRAKSAA